MNNNLYDLDDVSIERIIRTCSDETIAKFLISVDVNQQNRMLSLLSQKHKNAIYIELKNIGWIYKADIETHVDTFWKNASELEKNGEIIVIG